MSHGDRDKVTTTTTSERSWNTLIEERGIRATGARRAIFGAFFRARGHMTLQELQTRARRAHPSIGLATVYRTMRVLEDAGIAERHEFQDGVSRYEMAVGRTHHDHLICTGCGTIIEFESAEIERLQDVIAVEHDFEVRAHRHELYGLCEACRSPKELPNTRRVP